jgi:hypothetical protein
MSWLECNHRSREQQKSVLYADGGCGYWGRWCCCLCEAGKDLVEGVGGLGGGGDWEGWEMGLFGAEMSILEEEEFWEEMRSSDSNGLSSSKASIGCGCGGCCVVVDEQPGQLSARAVETWSTAKLIQSVRSTGTTQELARPPARSVSFQNSPPSPS